MVAFGMYFEAAAPIGVTIGVTGKGELKLISWFFCMINLGA